MRENLRFSLGSTANYVTSHLLHIESSSTLSPPPTYDSTPYDSSVNYRPVGSNTASNQLNCRCVVIDTNDNYGCTMHGGDSNVVGSPATTTTTTTAASGTTAAASAVVGGLDGSWGGDFVDYSRLPVMDPFASFRNVKVNEFEQFLQRQQEEKPKSPVLPAGKGGREIDWDAYMLEDEGTEDSPPPPPQHQQQHQQRQQQQQQQQQQQPSSTVFSQCGGPNAVQNWSDFVLPSGCGGPSNLFPLPSWKFTSSQNENKQFYNACWNGGDVSGGSGADCSLERGWREGVVEVMRKHLEECDRPESIQIFTEAHGEGSFWSGLGVAICNEFKDEVKGGVGIEISINDDLEVGKSNFFNSGDRDSTSTSGGEARKRFQYDLYGGISLYNRSATFDLCSTIDLSKCLDEGLGAYGGKLNKSGRKFVASGRAAAVIDAAYGAGGLGKEGDGGTVTINNAQQGVISLPCLSYRDLVYLGIGDGERGRKFVEVDACIAGDFDFDDLGAAEEGDQRLRGNAGNRVAARKDYRGDEEEKHAFFSCISSLRSTQVSASHVLASSIYSDLRPNAVCGVATRAPGLPEGGYFESVIERGGGREGIWACVTNSTRSGAWIEEVKRNLGKIISGEKQGFRGFLETEVARGGCGGAEDLLEGAEMLKMLSDRYAK